MRIRHDWIAFGTATMCAALSGCRGDPDVPYVFVFVLDGVRTDEISTERVSPLTGVPGQEWSPRVWDVLGPEAAAARAALNPGVTITAPAHAVLVTGRPQAYANYAATASGPGVYLPEVPTLFEAARAQLGLGAGQVLLVANTALLDGVVRSTSPAGSLGADYLLVEGRTEGQPADDDGPVFDAVRAAINDGPPRLMVVNVHDSDRAGHSGAVGEYADNVARADALLADFVEWLERAHPVVARNAMIVVTADHGRHSGAGESQWRNHGDACLGCRQVPLFVRGGGARAGQVLEGPWATQDLAPTLAAHLGVELPYADGLPLSPLVDGLDEGGRSGRSARSSADVVVAERVLGQAFEARAAAVFDGATLSSPEAFDVDALSVAASGSGHLACFRELVLTADADAWPWVPRCFYRPLGGDWEDAGYPLEIDGGPVWVAAIASDGDRFGLAWVANAGGAAQQGDACSAGTGDEPGVSIATYAPERGWSGTSRAHANFPTDPAIVRADDRWIAAVGTNTDDVDPEDFRYARIVRILDADGTAVASLDADALLGEDARAERPALRHADGVTTVAFVGVGITDRAVLVASSRDGGHTWSDPAWIEGADPFTHVTPVWDGADLVWAGLDAGEAVLCRALPGATAADCSPVGSPRIDALVVTGDGVLVTIDTGVGAWEPILVPR